MLIWGSLFWTHVILTPGACGREVPRGGWGTLSAGPGGSGESGESGDEFQKSICLWQAWYLSITDPLKMCSWCIMSTHDASWVLMMHHKYPWCTMRTHDASWVRMMHREYSWCIVSTHDVSWVLMMLHVPACACICQHVLACTNIRKSMTVNRNKRKEPNMH